MREGLSELVLTPAETDADLEDLIGVRCRPSASGDLQLEVGESDDESRGFLERRGFAQVGAEKALELELGGAELRAVEPPSGARIVSRVEEPDVLEAMHTVAVEADEDIPGSTETRTFEQWRAHEIDKPSRRPEVCFVAFAGRE